MSETVLDGIVRSLEAARDSYDPDAQVAPAALLWPDEGRQWEPAIERIAERLPVVSLGPYDPAARRGPAYWLRCVVAGTEPLELPPGTPIVYLPGVGRASLRASDECPPELAPIAELQYRSQWFSHPNNRDWTVWALLANQARGLGLRMAEDRSVASALRTALGRLLDERLDRVRQQYVDADYLRGLVNPDPVLRLLKWIDDPAGFRARASEEEWSAFRAHCAAEFELDLGEGEVSAARRLGERVSPWDAVWRRFAETPERFPGVAEQLRKARPDELVVERETWPQENERAEDALRGELRALAALTPSAARDEILRLDGEHAWRRGTVWADLDQAPLAFALEQLRHLAEATRSPLPTGDLDALVAAYAERGWRADDALLRVLAAAPGDSDREAAGSAAAALYRDWLDAGARGLQEAIGPLASSHGYRPGPSASTAAGTAILFVDGLRLDVGHRLAERLRGADLEVVAVTALAALPTVTQTAKAAVVPIAAGALAPGSGLHAANAATGTDASIQVLRALMAEAGVQVLEPGERGEPGGVAFAEAGEIDGRGHDEGAALVDRLDDELRRIVRRVRELLEAGWDRVEVITDHGWMLVPGGLEKVVLPPATAALKKGRCARLKEGAEVGVPTVPWHWDAGVKIALAPGAACFEANQEFEHGGVSPQENVVPRLTVTAGAAVPAGEAEIAKVKWLGLQCRVELSGVREKATVDLRGLPAEPGSSIAEQAKETTSAGRVSLIVPDEEHEGERAHLVLVASSGAILAQREVVVGVNR